MGGPVPSWEGLLAAVEQDVLHTEALLALAADDPDHSAGARITAIAAQLRPAADLPPADRMPVLPAGLGERVQALSDRVEHARAALEAAMTSARRQLAATSASAAPARPPAARAASFIDTIA